MVEKFCAMHLTTAKSSMMRLFLCKLPQPKKLLVVEEILCDVRRQIRSIVNLCEEFGVRHTRAKFTHQNNFYRIRKENRLIFFSAMLVPRTTERSGSSAMWNGIPVFFERRRSSPLINAPPPAR